MLKTIRVKSTFTLFLAIVVCMQASVGNANPAAARTVPPAIKISRGMRILPLDWLGSFLAVPGKLIFWNRKYGNHNISPEVEEDIRQYLSDNQLYDVQVRLNQFAPHSEIWRLIKNNRVGIPYRIFAFPFTLIYSSLGRLLGGSILMSDYYDPYSNTVHLFSDHTAIALHEGGHAKDITLQRWRGSYAFARMFGLTAYMQELTATEDAIDYLTLKQREKEAVESYKVLYPAYSSYIGSLFGFTGYFIAIAYGHWYGRFKARQLAAEFKMQKELETFRETRESPTTRPVIGL